MKVMKQTAVEWLVEQLVELDKQLDGRRKNDDATVLKLNPTKLFEQAKEMEKEQIEDAFEESRLTHPMIGFKHETFEDYYKKTFNTNEK
jgi:hypothetical protein